MQRSCFLAGAALLLVPALALAETHNVMPAGSARYLDIITTPTNLDDLQTGRQVLPPVTNPSAVALSRVVYLNRTGVTVSPGNNDARTNRSSIASQQTTIGAWNTDQTTWNATVACMRELFAPFDVQITETNPGNVNHIEAVFGGSPGQLGLPNGVAGVSPFTTNCDIIENSIVYTFTNVIPNDARLACEIMAQEVAHSYGLDHELLASDPMTYLNFNANRSFKDQTVSCGEDTARPCGINGSTCRPNQNSVQLLLARLGPAGQTGDTVAPTVGITSPQNGATVPPGFQILFDASDNVGVQMATLFVDGDAVGSLIQAPFTFTTSPTLPEGQHTFKIEVSDGKNLKAQEITVTVRKGAAPPVPPGSGGDDDGSADIAGGCSSSGGSAGLLFTLGLAGLVIRRRR